jgi:flagellar basal body-associated protein FliL
MSATVAPEAQVDAQPAPRPKSSRLVMIVVALAVVIVAQVAITFVALKILIPAPAAAAGDKTGEDPAAAQSRLADPAEKALIEATIGDFNVTNTKAQEGVTLHIDVKLTALCAQPHKQSFEEKLRHHSGRVRETVMEVIRACTLADLDDPQLLTIKRRVKEELNRLLRQAFIEQVVVTDFRRIEQ